MSLEVVPTEKPAPKMVEIPENQKAAAGWLLYKFATEQNTEHLKNLALFVAKEIGKSLTDDQNEMDKLITSYLEENGG